MKIKPNKKTFREIKDKEEKVQDFFQEKLFQQNTKKKHLLQKF